MESIQIDFKKSGGVIPVITQDAQTLEVLMLAYMNEEAFNKTLELNQMVYFSRSRNKLWHKGEESGHTQDVVELRIDCDTDTLLAKVQQKGAACHTGHKHCFYRKIIDAAHAETTEKAIVDTSAIYKEKH